MVVPSQLARIVDAVHFLEQVVDVVESLELIVSIVPVDAFWIQREGHGFDIEISEFEDPPVCSSVKLWDGDLLMVFLVDVDIGMEAELHRPLE
jgi:hypothetical protein